MKKIDIILKDSPLKILLISIVFISLIYLVSLHPDGFQLFFNFVMITGFVILTIFLMLWYTPFMKLYDNFISDKIKFTPVRAYQTFHQEVAENTKKSVDKLLESQQYKKYAQKKQQNPNEPVVLCSPAIYAQVQEDAIDLQALEKQIFDQQTQAIQKNSL